MSNIGYGESSNTDTRTSQALHSKAEKPAVRVLHKLLLVWGAGIAPIIIAVMAILQFTRPTVTEIKDFDSLIAVLEKASSLVSDETFASESRSDREILVEKVSNLNTVVTKAFNEREPNLEPFVLKQNESLYLVQPSGQRRVIALGRMFPINSYLYLGVDGDKRKLSIGQSVEFGPRQTPCTVTLMEIDETREEASFDYQC